MGSKCIFKLDHLRIQSVDGTLLDVLSATEVTVELASVSWSHSVVVANITLSILLGWTSSNFSPELPSGP